MNLMKRHFPIFLWLILAACTIPIPRAPQTQSPMPPSPPSNYGGIEIMGDAEFIRQTRTALALLEQKAPDAFKKVQTYIGSIEQGEHSGMWAWEDPPRYEVGDATAFFSVTWYASTIAHDATHSELYARYLAAHHGKSVPRNAYGGVEIERFCINYQIEVSRQVGAPQNEIDYLFTLDGTHCDLDHDGDCDWDDYQNRDW